MTLEEFEVYLHTWLKTKLNVADEKVQRAYQNADFPSYPFYTFHVDNSNYEEEENELDNGTIELIKLHTVKICIKAYTNEKYNKAMADLQKLREKLLSTDEVSEFELSELNIMPQSSVFSMKEEIQENEFVDMAYIDVVAEFNETETRDLGYFDSVSIDVDIETNQNYLPNLKGSIVEINATMPLNTNTNGNKTQLDVTIPINTTPSVVPSIENLVDFSTTFPEIQQVNNPPSIPLNPPVADFEGVILSGVAPFTVNFTDLSTNTPTSWAWDFDNSGSTDSTSQNPSHEYTTAGTYSVKLTVSNTDGSDTITKTAYIEVIENTNKDFTYLPYSKGGYWNYSENSNTATQDKINTNQVLTIFGNPSIVASAYGHYKVNYSDNNKYAQITSDFDLQSTTKYTFKHIFNLNSLKTVQEIQRKYQGEAGTAVAEWDFYLLNNTLYITMYENGGLGTGFHQIALDYVFEAGIDYSLIYSIDLDNDVENVVINQTTVGFTVTTGGNAKTLAQMSIFNINTSLIEIARYTNQPTWNGDFISHRIEILPDIYLNVAQSKAENAIFGL